MIFVACLKQKLQQYFQFPIVKRRVSVIGTVTLSSLFWFCCIPALQSVCTKLLAEYQIPELFYLGLLTLSHISHNVPET